ncbi:hypothetical protein F4778DRAFT_711978 [Xylariomycetidae sp. FL2044]|nr:hypothetical protein F4778DRAFT_711978 [Xylariomycetidae sp. FL2044]
MSHQPPDEGLDLKCLPTNVWEADIEGISIRWLVRAQPRLRDEAGILSRPLEEVKAITEHLCWKSAQRTGQSRVIITQFKRATPQGEL